MSYETDSHNVDHTPAHGIPRPYDYAVESSIDGQIPNQSELPEGVTPINKNRGDNQILVYEPARKSVIDTEPEYVEPDQPLDGAKLKDIGRAAFDADATFNGTRAHDKPEGWSKKPTGRIEAARSRIVNGKTTGERQHSQEIPVRFIDTATDIVIGGVAKAVKGMSGTPKRGDPRTLGPIAKHTKPRY